MALLMHRRKQIMICDKCINKSKCTKIISEKANYCEDRVVILTEYTCPISKSDLKDYKIIWR